MNRDTAIFKRSEDVAQRFLQTAVVVDDRAFLAEEEPEAPVPLAPPPTPSTIEPAAKEDAPVAVAPSQEAAQPFAPEPHRFEAQPVIDGFARRGIVCAVLQRNPDDTLNNPASRLCQLANVADILVVDWHVHSHGAESADETLELLEAVVTRNRDETPSQLRLVVVYTGEIHLLGVSEQIRARLQEKVGAVTTDGDFAFTQGAVRIVVLGKKTIAGRTPEAQSQEADFSELAGRTVSEFTAMTAGLVSNVVVDTLARLRTATHRVLGRFPTSLDAAFLVHRSLLDIPAEADEHLAPIIAAEFQAIIEDAIGEFTGAEVKEWLDARETPNDSHTLHGFPDAESERQWLVQLCDKGYKSALGGELPEALAWLREIGGGYGSESLDKLLSLVRGVALPGANEELSMLMALKTNYSSDPPRLTLGTIVMQPTENSRMFWLCLQPVCDSVRLSSSRGFPMLRLAVPNANDRFGLTVRVDDEFVRLRIDPRPFKVQTVDFKPDAKAKMIVSSVDAHQHFWFKSKDGKFSCRWIGELKFEQAQRAVQALANQSSRVGLTESEWQRRWDCKQADT